jgi:F-type H+-transporting ATPase subunit gamma
MSNLRTLRRRIRSVRNMQKIFKAMEMVAAAKLRRAQGRALAARPYSVKITEMLAKIARNASDVDHPLFKPREVKKTALVVVTSDQGLAGAYNTNLMRAAEQRLRQAPAGSITLVLAGKKGRDYFRRRKHPVLTSHTPLPGEASLDFARQLTEDLIARYIAGEIDKVEILYTQFISALRRKIVVETFVPIAAEGADTAPATGSIIFEPDAESILAELLTRYATAKMFAAMADALASEQGARMIAMGAARKNAGELGDLYVLQANRLRQASITKELLEIVGGAEALK